MIALIDADNVAVAAAWSGEKETEDIACARARGMLETIANDTGSDTLELWLTGKNNFRYSVYPEYKAQRSGKRRPRWEKQVKDYLISHHAANVTDGCEADDMLGVRLCELGEVAIMAHLDKDMNMIPGWHYNWELRRLGKVVREARKYYVTIEEANRFFYYQLIVGDPVDNIKGVVQSGAAAAEALLGSLPEHEWLPAIRDLYASEEELDLNARCLYIWRRRDDSWRNLIGQKEEHTPSL